MILSILKIKNTATLVKGRGRRRLELVSVGFCAQKPTTLTCRCASRCKMRLLEITLIRRILGLGAPVQTFQESQYTRAVRPLVAHS